MLEQPQLPAEKWPEIRRLKAAKNTGWSYFETLVKTIHHCELIFKEEDEQ